MFPADMRDETEWFLAAADVDMLAAEGIDAEAFFRAPDACDGVHEMWHTMQIDRVNLLDVIIGWDVPMPIWSMVPAPPVRHW